MQAGQKPAKFDCQASARTERSAVPRVFAWFWIEQPAVINAFAMLALLDAYDKFQDGRYLHAVRTIGVWIFEHLVDQSRTGYGGYFLGYEDGGNPSTLFGKSVENNADIFVAFSRLAEVEQTVGFGKRAGIWRGRASLAGNIVLRMFDASRGCFFAGTVPMGTPAGPGIKPGGPSRGRDVINTSDFLDSNSFTTLALAASPRYRNTLDWRRPVRCVTDHFARSKRAALYFEVST